MTNVTYFWPKQPPPLSFVFVLVYTFGEGAIPETIVVFLSPLLSRFSSIESLPLSVGN